MVVELLSIAHQEQVWMLIIKKIYYTHDNYIYKRWNYFLQSYNSRIFDGFNPDAVDGDGNLTRAQFRGKGFQNPELDLTWQLQINNKKYPEFECQSLTESAYYLRRTLHYLNPDQDAFSISYKRYREDKTLQMKLRNSQEASVAFRKHIEKGHARANYQNELDRLTMELHRPNLPHSTLEHLQKRIEELKKKSFT